MYKSNLNKSFWYKLGFLIVLLVLTGFGNGFLPPVWAKLNFDDMFGNFNELRQKVKGKTISSHLYADASYTQPSRNFNPGQTIYLKVESSVTGTTTRLARLLNSGKAEVSQTVLSRSGSNPYVFTSALTAPVAAGTYYVDIKIEGEGSIFNSQENITVGGESDDSVSSVINNQVNTGGQEINEETGKAASTVKPAPPTTSESGYPVPQPLEAKSAWARFFNSVFFWFFRAFGLDKRTQ